MVRRRVSAAARSPWTMPTRCSTTSAGPACIYLHSPDRPALVLAAVRQSCTGPTGRLRSVADEGGNDTCQRRNALCRTCPAFAYGHPQRYRVVFGGFGHPVVALDKDDTPLVECRYSRVAVFARRASRPASGPVTSAVTRRTTLAVTGAVCAKTDQAHNPGAEGP